VANHYCTLDQLRGRLNLPTGARTELDRAMGDIISNVSRQINLLCNRHFYVRERTWQWTYQHPHKAGDGALLIPDVLSLTSLKTDSSSSRTYPIDWATTDYDLLPAEAPYSDPPSPYTRIARRPLGRYSFPPLTLGVQAIGKGGFYEVLERSAATVGVGGISDSDTTLPFSDGSTIEVGMTLLIGSEQLFVAAMDRNADPDAATCERGVNGTVAAAHAEDDPIDVYTYPVVSEACLEQSKRRYERSIGRAGRETEPGIRNYGSLDRDIEEALGLLRRRGV
jgi:hypothetical protein